MDKGLNQKILEYSQWRSDLHAQISALGDFLRHHNITDLRTHHQLENLLEILSDDKLSVAFVAEFSRGKSEMINTIFFGDYDRRILPSGTGRTTMCPTELMYDAERPTGLRLLPIETRRSDLPLFELKKDSSQWTEIEFDETDQEAVAQALTAMTESKLVSKAYAQDLEFDLLENNDSEIGLPLNEYDEVEIPSWRHAVINLPHPLLEQGLVILDTPGLNAIGAEPELAINQLAKAHAVVFVLAHDTGVTTSDLTLWQQHLGGANRSSNNSIFKSSINNERMNKDLPKTIDHSGKLVVLNKLDALWDGIRSEQQIEQEVRQQIQNTAITLKLDQEQIYSVSAQKGLLGKLNNDQKLIDKSQILEFENALAERLLPRKQDIVVNQVKAHLEDILDSAKSILDNRLKDTDEHIAELRQLSSKNVDVITHIMQKVQSEKSSLEGDMQRYQALRSVYAKETEKLISLLSVERLEKLIAKTKHNMSRCASSLTLQKTITKYFERLNYYVEQAGQQANEIAALSENITRDFEQDHGISHFRVRRLQLEKFVDDIGRLENKHAHLKETKTLFFKEQMTITNRFYESVCVASRKIFTRALNSATNWNNHLMVPMETHVREHHAQLRRRLESVKQIHKASDSVEMRLAQLENTHSELIDQHSKFSSFQSQLADQLTLKRIAAKTIEFDQQASTETADILYWDKSTHF